MFVSLHLLTFSPWFKWVHELILPSTEQKREKCIILLCNYSYIFYIVTLAILKTKQGREARVFMRVTSAGSKNLCSVSNSELVHHLFHLKKKLYLQMIFWLFNQIFSWFTFCHPPNFLNRANNAESLGAKMKQGRIYFPFLHSPDR